MRYPKSRQPGQELQLLIHTKGYSTIDDEQRTPNTPYSYVSESNFGDDFLSEYNAHSPTTEYQQIKTAFVVSYILLFAAVIALMCTIISLMLTRQHAKTSMSFPQSFPLFTDV